MSDFTAVPSWGSELEEEPRVLLGQFGDGYAQRVGDGINTIAQVWSLRWENLTSAAADAIMTFFRTKNGVTIFTWTPPGGSEIKVICKKWKRSYPDFTHTITATFEQQFDV